MQTQLKVLVIEDRRENIVFLANNVLKPKGFEVITAMDGETGLRKALEEVPDLIITDLKLPKMHGLDVLADLQDRGASIPTIVMTFHGSEDTAIKAFRLGAKDYLIKPFSLDAVEMALERALGKTNATATADEKLIQRTKMLETKIKELEAYINQNPPEPVNIAEQDVFYQQEIERWKQECARLKQALEQQKQFTQEARTSAKAMMSFIRQQQKEINKKRNEAVKLSKQVQTLSNNLNQFAAQIDAQARQFNGPST